MQLEPIALETGRLMLRPLSQDDAPSITALVNDWDVARSMLVIPHPYELKHATDWIATHAEGLAAGREIHWGITKRDDAGNAGELLGVIGVHVQRLHHRAGFGYWLGKAHWGQGYATEAVTAVVRYCFESLSINRLWAEHFPDNPASGRVLEKAGLAREGVLRQQYFRWGRYHDSVVYSILRQEYEQG
jgi:[ribosomal protein S5]-alanine N-acetyltransferase